MTDVSREMFYLTDVSRQARMEMVSRHNAYLLSLQRLHESIHSLQYLDEPAHQMRTPDKLNRVKLRELTAQVEQADLRPDSWRSNVHVALNLDKISRSYKEALGVLTDRTATEAGQGAASKGEPVKGPSDGREMITFREGDEVKVTRDEIQLR